MVERASYITGPCDAILWLYAYPKKVTADLTRRQIAQLAQVVKEEFGNEEGDV